MRLVAIVLAVSLLLACVPAQAQGGWITVVSPRNGEMLTGRNAEVSVSFSVGAGDKVTSIEVVIEGSNWGVKYLAEPSSRGIASFLIDTSNLGNGSHTVLFKLFSGDRLVGSASSACQVGNRFVDVLPPTISFAGMRDDAVVSGVTAVKLLAKDNSGEDPMVSVYLDKSLKMIRNSPPYEYLWNTKEIEDGRHVLTACAFDGAGNKAEAASVSVVVQNSLPQAAEVARASASMSDTKKPASKSDTILTNSLPVAPASATAKRGDTSSARSVDRQPVARVVAKPLAKAEKRTADPIRPVLIVKAPVLKPETAIVTAPGLVAIPQKSGSSDLVVTPAAPIGDPELARQVAVSEPATATTDPVATNPSDALPPAATSLSPAGVTYVTAPASVTQPTHSTPIATPASDSEEPVVVGRVATVADGIPSGQKIIRPSLPVVAVTQPTKLQPIRIASAPKPEPVLLPPSLEPRKPRFLTLRTADLGGTRVTELREAITAAGGTVLGWDHWTKTATVMFQGSTVSIQAGKAAAVVDGQPVAIRSKPYINAAGRTVVDVAFLKSVIGEAVSVDANTGQCRLMFD